MGATIKQQFSDNPQVQDIRLATGSATAINFPNLPVLMVRFKAYIDNVGRFYLGETPNDMYWELSAGDDTGWVAIQNMNHLYYKDPSGTLDKMAYWIQR